MGELINNEKGRQKGKQKVEPVQVQDGHLFMCDYLFSLAYHAKVRINSEWYMDGQAMLLSLAASEARCEVIESDFKKTLEHLAESTCDPKVPCGAGKFLSSYDGAMLPLTFSSTFLL